MQVARTSGLQTANKRGLLNSSIAAGASEGAAIQYATPLAVADAQNAGARNLARVNAYFTGQQQQADIASREQMLTQQLTSDQQMQAADIASKLQMQGIDINNQQQMQQAQIAAERQLTQMNIDAAAAQLGRQLTAQEKMQASDLAAQQARLAMQIASQEKIATQDAQTRVQLETLQNQSAEKTAALNYYLGQDQIYAQGVTSLYGNADLPAPARDQALTQLTTMKNSGVNLPAALFGLDLSWPTSTGTTTSAPTGSSPTSPSGGLLGTGGSTSTGYPPANYTPPPPSYSYPATSGSVARGSNGVAL